MTAALPAPVRAALAYRPRRPVPGGPLTAARVALSAFFALDGFVFAGWVVRIPAIKAQVGASASALGLALLGVSAGAVATMLLTGRLCRRFGSERLTVGCAALLSLSVALPPLTRSASALGAVLLVFGAAYGALNVAMNSLAVDLVAALRRPVMPGFHAAFSFGGLLGSGLGGLLAPHLSPTRHLLLLVPIGLLTTAVAGRALLTRRPSAGRRPVDRAAQAVAAGRTARAGDTARQRGASGRLVFLFGLIAACTAYGEGALADWSALHLTQDLGAGPGLAATAYAPFALAMAVGRLTGTRLLERFGQTRTLLLGGLAAAAGMLLGALAPLSWLVLAGFAVTGLGLANIFPIAVARAGALSGPGGVAVASTLGYGGMLLGPPSIGFLAEKWGLPTALTTVAMLAAAASLIALRVPDNAPAGPARCRSAADRPGLSDPDGMMSP